MRSTIITTLLVLLPLLAVSQYTSVGGRFQVDERKGCAALTMNMTNTNLITIGECTPGKPCVMEWGDGTANQTNTFQHTYTNPGTYTLKILYQTIGYDEIQITVTPNVAPDFDIYTCSNREVQVKVNDTSYDAYIINYNDGSPEVLVPKGSMAVDNHTYATTGAKSISVRGKDVNAADNCVPANTKTVAAVNALTAPFVDQLTVTNGTDIALDFNNASYSDNIVYRLQIAVNTNNAASLQQAQTLHDVSSTSISSLRTDDNYYCFRLAAYDPCNNTSLNSNIICSANFDLTPQNNVNALNWSTATTGVSSFSVNRDGGTIATTGALIYADNNVTCNTDYCYQVITNYSNGSQSISLEKCGTAFSTDVPTAINNISAIVDGGSVQLIWEQDPAFQTSEYQVFRKSANQNYSLLTSTPDTQLLDEAYSTSAEYCYKISYTDICDNRSAEGIEACPIRLSGKVNKDNSFELAWSAYSGWENNVDEYIVEKYDLQGNLLQSFNRGTNTTFTDNTNDPINQGVVFVVKAFANDGALSESVSNEISLLKELNLYYPKAFTPNNDNLNDVFVVFGQRQYMAKFELKIFNRWGELMFTTSSIEDGWNGQVKGVLQPEGTYAFVAKITDLAGRTFDRTGSFVLLKK